jgi:hypothetical protein
VIAKIRVPKTAEPPFRKSTASSAELIHCATLRVDGDHHVVGRDALVDADPGVEALDRRQAAVEARGFVLGSQVIDPLDLDYLTTHED